MCKITSFINLIKTNLYSLKDLIKYKLENLPYDYNTNITPPLEKSCRSVQVGTYV